MPTSVPGLPPRMSSAFPFIGYQLNGGKGTGAHAGAAVTLKAAEGAVTTPAVASKVSPVPTALTERFGKVAMPAVFVIWVKVPPRVPGPEFNVRVIARFGTTAAVLSSALTWIAGVIGWLTRVLVGWVTKDKFATPLANAMV